MFEWIKRLLPSKEKGVAMHPAIYRQVCATSHGELLRFIKSNLKLKIKPKRNGGAYITYCNRLITGYGLSSLTTYHDQKGKIVHFTLSGPSWM